MKQSSYKGGEMKKALALSIISGLVFLLWISYSIGAIPVDVTVGKETVLTLKNASQRISLANPGIADVKLISPTEIVINGKKAGITSLIVWDSEGKKFYDVVVSDYTEINNEHKKEDLLSQIKVIAPDADVKVHIVGDTIILTGRLKNEVTRKRIETLALNYAPKVTNLISIEEAQQVILEVKVAQIDKTKMKDLGISALTKQATWELTAPGLFATPSGTVGGFTTSGSTSTSGTTTGSQGVTGKVTPGIGGFDVGALSPQIGAAYFPGGVAAVLRALAQKGYAKILAEPNLIVRSGDAGEFFVGTRVPVQEVTGVGASQTVSITFENVGIKLNFKPEVLETGAIRLKIDPAEVANITSFLTFQGIVAPEIDTRRVSTGVDLKDGESLVLAGLLSEETKKNIQKMPIFGDIPILGAIFRSTHDELTQKELAFFITPHLIKPISAGVKTELPEERRLSPQEEREFNWIPLPPSSSEQEPGKKPSGGIAPAAPVNGNLAEEINLFMDQYRKAYEFGDVDRFMSLYSKSAVENGMNYNDIRRSYQKNFRMGRYSYTLKNPQVQRRDDLVELTGSFSIKRTGEEGPVSRGNIRWTLEKEDGVLKIVKVEY
jgi:pilus assembly protein CpaC